MDAGHSDTKPPQDPVRTAGVLLLIACGLDLATWGIQTRWGWKPTALGITETALQAVLGVGLIRSGRMWALPTMVFMAVSALIPCIRAALSDTPNLFAQTVVLSVPLVVGLLRLGPFLLLLTSHGTRLRRAVAIGLFVVCQVIELAGIGLNIYAVERMKQRAESRGDHRVYLEGVAVRSWEPALRHFFAQTLSTVTGEKRAMTIPAKVSERLSSGLKRFAPILAAAKSRDVNESDTSMIVTDMLADIYGYDKYSEVTRELAIRGTYCDLATRIDGKFQMLIEVKAIGLELKDAHAKQAVDYAANLGVEWVALTNGPMWKVFRVIFAKPIDAEVVLDIDLLTLNAKSASDLESLHLLTRESMLKSGLYAYHDHLQATNKFYLAAVVLSDPVLDTIRRELRRVSDAKVELVELREALQAEVIKREVIEGDKADGARKKVSRAAGKMLRIRKGKDEPEEASGDAHSEMVQATPAQQRDELP